MSLILLKAWLWRKTELILWDFPYTFLSRTSGQLQTCWRVECGLLKEIMLFIEFLVSQISNKTLYLTCNASPTAVNGGVIQDETRRECQHRVNTERLFLHLYAVVSAVFYWQTALLSLNSQAHNNGFPKVILKTALMVKCRSRKRQGQREEPRLKFSQVFFKKKKKNPSQF